MGRLLPQFPEIITVFPVCGILSPKIAGTITKDIGIYYLAG